MAKDRFQQACEILSGGPSKIVHEDEKMKIEVYPDGDVTVYNKLGDNVSWVSIKLRKCGFPGKIGSFVIRTESGSSLEKTHEASHPLDSNCYEVRKW